MCFNSRKRARLAEITVVTRNLSTDACLPVHASFNAATRKLKEGESVAATFRRFSELDSRKKWAAYWWGKEKRVRKQKFLENVRMCGSIIAEFK